MRRISRSILLASLGVALACAATPTVPLDPAKRQAGAVRPDGDRIAVDDFRRVCDSLASDLVQQPLLAAAASPPVVTIRQLENKTDNPIDAEIFQETIRVKLLGRAGGKVLFRDDASYADMLRERVRASAEDVNVTLTDNVVDVRHRSREFTYATGNLSGAPSAVARSELRADQSGRVSGGLARADYFLRGIVYEMEETSGRSGSYFQYQFRLVDANSGIIVWEKMLDSRPGDPYQTTPPVGGALSLAQASAAAPSAATVKPAVYRPAGMVNPVTPAVSSGPSPASVVTAPAIDRPAERAVVPARPPLTELPPLAFGRYHALVIGNERYASLPRLRASANDARAVATLLEDTYGYDVTLLLDASRREIVSALSAYRHELGPDDNLLVYYAGHGWYDEDATQGYWLPVEAREDDPANWLSNATINDMLRANEAQHILVVADSCYSGTLTRGVALRGKAASNRTKMFRKLLGKRSRTALTSGGLEPVEDDGGSGHSVFAEAFLAGLRENPGVLDGHGLFSAVRRRVMVEADQTPEYGDIRRVGHEGGDFLFVMPTPSETISAMASEHGV